LPPKPPDEDNLPATPEDVDAVEAVEEDDDNDDDFEPPPRPQTRGDCVQTRENPHAINAIRPCPWVSCKYHLQISVNPETGKIYHGLDPDDWTEDTQTCALDLADQGGAALDEVGRAMGVVRERVRQLEARALKRIREALTEHAVERPITKAEALARKRKVKAERLAVEREEYDFWSKSLINSQGGGLIAALRGHFWRDPAAAAVFHRTHEAALEKIRAALAAKGVTTTDLARVFYRHRSGVRSDIALQLHRTLGGRSVMSRCIGLLATSAGLAIEELGGGDTVWVGAMLELSRQCEPRFTELAQVIGREGIGFFGITGSGAEDGDE